MGAWRDWSEHAENADPRGSTPRLPGLLGARSEVCGVGGGVPHSKCAVKQSPSSQPSAALTAQCRRPQRGFIAVIKSYQLYVIGHHGGQLGL